MNKQIKNNWIKDKPIAHRGLHSNPEVPENSLKSFELAIEKGLPIELDLQLTKDNKVVVFHDDDLKRVCNDERDVSEVELSELEQINLYETTEKIPSLQTVLDFVNGQVPLLIEIKNRTYNGKLEDIIFQELKDYQGDYAIQSFNPYTVLHFKKLDPTITRGLISGTGKDFGLPPWKVFILRNLFFYPILKPHFINYEADGLNLTSISLLRKFNLVPILGWTIDTDDRYQKYKDLCDNVIFEKIQL